MSAVSTDRAFIKTLTFINIFKAEVRLFYDENLTKFHLVLYFLCFWCHVCRREGKWEPQMFFENY